MIITENTDNERVLSNITRSLGLLSDPYAVRGYDSHHLYANLAINWLRVSPLKILVR